MEKILKGNIYIIGFDKNNPFDRKNGDDEMFNLFHSLIDDDIIYIGQTKDIKEEDIKEYVDSFNGKYSGIRYLDYGHDVDYIFEFKTAKESILSACKEKYCIIYRKNEILFQ